MSRANRAGLQVSSGLAALLEEQVFPRLDLDPAQFWSGMAELFADLSPVNQSLLDRRDALQSQIDNWHKQNTYDSDDLSAYKRFLEDIGYLLPDVGEVEVTSTQVDPEIASLAGPQLVVPIMNARFALNAANARWGSLYDALYGTDAIPEEEGKQRAGDYNPVRGAAVIAWARDFLDRVCPLVDCSFSEVEGFKVTAGRLLACSGTGETGLRNPMQFAGYTGDAGQPRSVLLRNHGLHIEILLDRDSEVGRNDPAGISDVVLEAAITTIQDCEDSVAAVDAADKLLVYSNWLGLIEGSLSESFLKEGVRLNRVLATDKEYTSPAGQALSLPGRSLMLIRNVGHLMRTDAVLDAEGNEVFEGILDAIVTAAIAALDVRLPGNYRNTRTGSIYIVKPKMHGPEEVAFCCELFRRVEELVGLRRNTLKVGIMDEERRTTLNLKACINAARERVVFINTGFLDRTGDEIHTSMHAGPMVPKADMKSQRWIVAYEKHNVAVGLACGLRGHAQIGKGMWAMPDRMAQMLEEKIAQPLAGATTAWVPSPTAAVLHATHYHLVDVASQQTALASEPPPPLDALLTIPLQTAAAGDPGVDADTIKRELDNNAQGILGYVVRWVDQGIGCSKVPDINDIGLMEDRATLRISSQHIANWLHHGLCTQTQVEETMRRMAAVVDGQNAHDPAYTAMGPDFDNSVAFQAARSLVFDGLEQPSGYTEPLLHSARRKVKAGI